MALLFFHSIASLVLAECACASLFFTSFTDFLSVVCVEPKYLKRSTSSSVCPFICMLEDGPGAKTHQICSMIDRKFFSLPSAIWNLSCRYCHDHLMCGDKPHFPPKSAFWHQIHFKSRQTSTEHPHAQTQVVELLSTDCDSNPNGHSVPY